MKRRVLVSLALVVAAGLVFAVDADFGLNLDSASTIRSGGDADSETEFRAALWGKVYQPMDHGGAVDLVAQGSYRYTADRPYIVDLDLFRFTGLFSRAMGEGTAVELKAGRFRFADATKLILDHNLDGVALGLLFSGVQVRLGAGYSGFLLNPSSDIRISADDFFAEEDDSEFFGPKRVVGQASVAVDGFVVQALGQLDMRDDDEAETVATSYLGIAGVPRLTQNFYLEYHLTGSYGRSTIGEKDTNLIAALAGFGLRFYAEELLFSRAHAKMTYASGFLPTSLAPGLEDWSWDGFRSINQPTLGLVFSPRLQNLTIFDLGYSFRPFAGDPSPILSNIQPLVGAKFFFRDLVNLLIDQVSPIKIGPADILASHVNPDSDALYLGTELEAGVVARIFSDLGLSVKGGVFLPSTGDDAAFTTDRETEFVVTIEVSAAF